MESESPPDTTGAGADVDRRVLHGPPLGTGTFTNTGVATAGTGRAGLSNETGAYRRRLSYREVIAIYMRDGGLCGICHQPVDPESATIDHVMPRARGGSDHIGNMQLAHGRCNSAKWATLPAITITDFVPREMAESEEHRDDSMTVSEAAIVLNVNTATIRYRIQRGDMQAERAGVRLWLIQREEVERWKVIGKLPRGPKPRQRQARTEGEL